MIHLFRLPLLALVACVAAAALVASGCGDGDDDTSAPSMSATLILDWFPNADHAGIYAADGEGFFADAGVKVDLQVPSDPAASLKQVAAGQAEFAITYAPELLIARSEGIPVAAVGAIVTAPLNAVLARSDRGISRPRDLEGKVVGIAGVPSDRPLLDTVVRADGGDPAKVKVRTVGFTLAPALAAGRVDATIGTYWNIEGVELAQKGVKLETFRLEEFGVPSYDELVLVTSDALLRDRPELVRGVAAGLSRGQEWAVANQDRAVAHLAGANPDLDRVLSRESLRLVAPLLHPPDTGPLALDLGRWQELATWMSANGLLRKPVEATSVVAGVPVT